MKLYIAGASAEIERCEALGYELTQSGRIAYCEGCE